MAQRGAVKNAPSRGRPKAPFNARRRQRPQASNQLDPGARQYMRLLRDPCGAPLAKPLYSSTAQGYITRVHQTHGLTVTDHGFVQVTPSLWNSNDMWMQHHTGDSAVRHFSDMSGVPFLQNMNIRSARCVAACLKVLYVGERQHMGGRVGCGYHTFVPHGHTPSVSELEAAMQVTRPTDGSVQEVRWLPNEADKQFSDGKLRDSTVASASALVLGPGKYVFEFYGVYEWEPPGEAGIKSPLGVPASTVSWKDFLTAMGPPINWMFKNGPSIMRAVATYV